MRLAADTLCALRTLQLAALHAPDTVRVDDVVTTHGLDRPENVNGTHERGHAGHIVKQRGGEFRLAKPPEAIRVGDIAPDPVACFNPDAKTRLLIGICRPSRKLRDEASGFIAVLDDLTIAFDRGQLPARVDAGQGVAGPEARP